MEPKYLKTSESIVFPIYMQLKKQNPNKTKTEIDLEGVKTGENYVEIDGEVHQLEPFIIEELKRWYNKDTHLRKHDDTYKKDFLFYMVRALYLLKPKNKTETRETIKKLSLHGEQIMDFITFIYANENKQPSIRKQDVEQYIGEPEMRIPEMNIEFGYNYVIIDDYYFKIHHDIVEVLKRWWYCGIRYARDTDEYRKEKLLYFCKAIVLMGDRVIRSELFYKYLMISNLEQYKDFLEKIINRIWENIYG